MERSLLRLPGDRNLIPCLAASAVGAAYAAKTQVISCLLSFTGCPGHFQVVDRNGVRLYLQLNNGLPSKACAVFVGYPKKTVILTG